MTRPLYLLITVSAPIFAVTVASLVLYDIIWTYRQRAQAEKLLHSARGYFDKNSSEQRSTTDEMVALHDMIACHEMSVNYRKTARKKNNSPTFLNHKTLM
jgi:heme/copper-type cytochrome/quinol oxidase subunit 1